MDGAADEELERDGSENEGEGGEEGENQAKLEYVKKEFVARPYANAATEVEVRSLTTKNTR